ncbi:probable pseudouridine-5'-phosphatase [Dendroctonus ponderosae]|uniref:probable pseudouridine-5'-phosphatase n=1 Tax=Dendroctonus ponderosae TaxID=77166 RepID=UPI002034CD22|nr:probable pseudouridine-5'-phosphatase [Dendroctonus ponderosae]
MHPHCCNGSGKYKPVTHVIFDLDGTIIDSESVYAKALQQTIEDYGCEFYPDFITKVQGSVEKQVGRIAIETFNLDTTLEEFIKLYNFHSNKYLGDLELMPGAERMITHLHNHNVPIAVASSTNREAFELKTNKYQQLFACFHHIVCGGTDPEVKNGKPAPDIFLIAASRFDNPPEPAKCLVFEDSKNGMLAAVAAGMQVVMLPEPQVSYDIWKLATLRLDSFNYMLPEIFGLPPFSQEDTALVFADAKVTLTEPIQVLLDPEEKKESGKRVVLDESSLISNDQN